MDAVGAEDGGAAKVMRKASDIDTSAPFRSVKEAVSLFGERVLAGEIYAHKLRQNRASEQAEHSSSKLGTITVELEETKQNLQKSRDERVVLATCLSALQQELERTKLELQQLKQQESKNQVIVIEPEIVHEDVKHVEDDATKSEAKTEEMSDEKVEFQKKRYVTFANPPSLAKFMVPQGDAVLERHPSLRKTKKKPLIPLIGGIFSRKKGSSGAATTRV